MILLGRKQKYIATIASKDESCPSCYKLGTLNYHVYGECGTVYWIPTISNGLIVSVKCNSCWIEISKKQFPPNLKEEYKTYVKPQVKTPLWYWTGSFIAILAIAGIALAINNSSKREAERMNAPMVNDVYKYEMESKEYTTMKVIVVEGDSVGVVYNDWATDKSTGLKEIDKTENYTDSMYIFLHKNEILEMYEAGSIYGVFRD